MGRMEVKESQALFPPVGRNRTSETQSVCDLATKNIRLEYGGVGIAGKVGEVHWGKLVVFQEVGVRSVSRPVKTSELESSH